MSDISGTDGNNNLSGTKGDDVIYGNDGDDHLNSKAGDDVIDGGEGNDHIIAGDGADMLKGGSGDDLLHGGLGQDTAIFTGSIKDYAFGRNGEELLVTGLDGSDRLLHIEQLRFDDALIILGVNNAPIAFDDTAAATEDAGTLVGTGSVLSNDFDFEGDVMRAVAGTFTGTYGTLTLNQDGTYSYTLNPGAQALAQGQTVQDVFTYTVTDGSLSDTGKLTITIAGANDAPTAHADAATTSENAALLVDVLANDTDLDNGAVLSVTAASAPAGQGSATVVGNQVRYDPGSDFDQLAVGQSAAVLVTYTIQDEHGAASSSSLTVTVTGTNDGPVAGADIAATGENDAVVIDVLANDTDVDNGAVLTVTAASVPAGQGSVAIVGNQVRFDPGADFDHLAAGASAVVNVSYTISDEHGATSSATSLVTVTGTNDGPVANADAATTSEDAAVLIDVLANDTDADDGAVLTVSGASAPAGQGSASVVGNQVRYDPGSDFDYLAVGQSAAVLVTYTIVDDQGATATGTVSVTITGANDGPVANADTGTTSENAALLVDVLANDTDADQGAVLTVTGASVPASQGSVSVVGNHVRFDPGSDFDGLAVGQSTTVTVGYTVSDEQGATADSAITIVVTGTNDGPVAVADSAAAGENAAILIDVLANDSDVDSGAVLTVTGASVPAGQGSASVVGNQVGFDPGTDFDHLAAGQSATVTVSYTISDEHGATAGATVTVTVNGTNDGPVANADSAATGENAAVLIDVLANDTDADDGAVLAVTGASAPAGQGSATVVGNQVRYDPGSDFDGLAVGETASVTLSYTIQDDQGATATSSIAVTVTGANDAPTIDVANSDIAAAVTELPNNDPAEDTFLHESEGVIAFDDLDLTDTHSASFAPQGAGYLGSFTLDPLDQAGDTVGWNFSVSDSVLDALGAGEVLTQTYTIQVSDGNGGTASQDVTVTITGAADGPVVPDGVWFIDNSAVGSANLGTYADPFTSIAAFNAAQGSAGGPAAGHTIYLREGTGTYAEADGINLLDGQTLIGGGQDLIVGGDLIETGTGRPTIVTTGGTNHGVELAQNNQVSGFDVGSTTGAGISDGNGSVGNLLVTDVGKSGSGQILDIDQGGTLDVTLNGAASTSSTGGAIDLAGVGGNFTVSGATTIAGAASGGISITASSVAANLAGGGSVASGGSTAIAYTGNSGSLNIGGGNFDIVTTGGAGVQASGGGSVTITGAGNDVSTGSGIAVSISGGTAIGGGGITLESVTTNGASSGIILNGTGAGSFSVTGTGTAGTGGAILSSINSGVVLTNTGPVLLANLTIGQSGTHGIAGAGIAGGLTLDTVSILNNGNAAGENGVLLTNVTGTVALLDSLFSGNAASNVAIANSSGSLTLAVQGSTFLNNPAVATGLNGLGVDMTGSASLDALITGSTFAGARSSNLSVTNGGSGQVGVQVGLEDVAGSGGSFANANTSITLNQNSIGSFRFDVLNATIANESGQASPINVNMATGARGPMSGSIQDNAITNHAGSAGNAIRIISNGTDNVVPIENILTVLVADNVITNHGVQAAVQLIARNGNSTLNATVLDNDITGTNTSGTAHGIEARAGAANADTVKLNLDIRGNQIDLNSVAEAAGAFDIRLVRVTNTVNSIGRIEDYVGGATDALAIQAYLSGLNNGASAFAQVNTVNGAGWGFIDDVPMPLAPFHDLPLIP